MVKHFIAIGAFAGALFAFAGPSQAAEEFPATPTQHGAPRDLPGENLIPGVDLAVNTIDGVTKPILDPILGPEQPAAAPAAKPARHHARHHHAAATHGHKAAWHKAAWHKGGKQAAWHGKAHAGRSASVSKHPKHTASR